MFQVDKANGEFDEGRDGMHLLPLLIDLDIFIHGWTNFARNREPQSSPGSAGARDPGTCVVTFVYFYLDFSIKFCIFRFVVDANECSVALNIETWPRVSHVLKSCRCRQVDTQELLHKDPRSGAMVPRCVQTLFFVDGMWVFPKMVVPQKWMVFIMENPILKWMIWRENPLFLETPM